MLVNIFFKIFSQIFKIRFECLFKIIKKKSTTYTSLLSGAPLAIQLNIATKLPQFAEGASRMFFFFFRRIGLSPLDIVYDFII